jgi:hypothetical protein
MTSRDQSGQIAGIEAIAFGFLVLVIGVLVISQAWGVIDAKTAAREAALEGARTYVTANVSDAVDADSLATAAAQSTLADFGYAPVVGTGDRLAAGSFERCSVVTWEVSVRVPAFRLPWISGGPSFFTASAFESERVDPYRSGVPGADSQGGAVCGGGDVVP